MTMTSQFSNMTSTTIFFEIILFLLSILVTGPSFIPIWSLVLELWHFFFIRDWPEIRKSEIPPSAFCPISGDRSKLWIPNLARVSLIEWYWMMQHSRVTALTFFELLRENQLVRGGGCKITLRHPSPPHTHTPRLGLRTVVVTKLLASGILFWTSLIFLFTTVVVTKSMVSGIILSTSLL